MFVLDKQALLVCSLYVHLGILLLFGLDYEKNKNELDVEEFEDLYGASKVPVSKPYNPLDVDIIQQPLALRNIFDRLENNEIVLDPDF